MNTGMLRALSLLALGGVRATGTRTSAYVGIDLGTTYSCVSMYLKYPNGKSNWEYLDFRGDDTKVIPSTVYADQQVDEKTGEKKTAFSLGYIAKSMNDLTPKPDGYFYGFKRLMGIDDITQHRELKDFQKHVTYQVVRKTKVDPKTKSVSAYYAFPYIEEKKTVAEFTPAGLSKMLLKNFHQRITSMGCDAVSTVICTPAYFSYVQDEETKAAAEAAGFTNVSILKEPVAACLTYAEKAGLKVDQEDSVLVFDFGGGTLDITLCGIEKLENDEGTAAERAANPTINTFLVKDYVGDNFLGGENINNELVSAFLKKMRQIEATNKGVSLEQAKVALSDVDQLRLRGFVETFKIELCNKAKQNASYVHEDTFITSENVSYALTMSLGEFNAACAPVYKRINDLFTDSVIGLFRTRSEADQKDGKPTVARKDIKKIVLVGGSTKVPEIVNLLKRLCPAAQILDSIDVDTSVAYGASQYAASLDSSSGVSSVTLLNSAPLAVGIEVVNGVMSPIINKGDNIPITNTQQFTTVEDGQKHILVRVASGVRPLFKDNHYIGNLTLVLDNPMPAGVPKIEVSIAMDANYGIVVTAKDLATNKEVQNIFEKNLAQPPAEQLNAMYEEAEANAEEDNKKIKNIEARARNQAAIARFEAKVATMKLSEELDLHAKAIITGYKGWLTENQSNAEIDADRFDEKTRELEAEVAEFEKMVAESKTDSNAEQQQENVPETNNTSGKDFL